MDPRDLVERGYDAIALQYAKLESPDALWPRMRWLEVLLERLTSGSHVLDVGCGSGIPAAARIAKEHRVTGIDISRRQIQLAQRNVPSGRFEKADVMAASFKPATFDAIVAFYVIEHVPREQHATLLERFGLWLRDGGYLLFTTESEADPGRVGEWLHVPMYISQYDPRTTLRLVRDAGFSPLSTSPETQLEGERAIDYLWVLAQRQRRSADRR